MPRVHQLLLFSIFYTVVRAATPVAELGQNLTYLRSVDPAADLAVMKVSATAGSLVLDLRRAAFSAASSQTWLTALRALPASKTVRLVLISPATAPELLKGFAAGVPGCLTIGRAADNCHPDLVVATDAASETRAEDALAAGTAPAVLATEILDKPRHDEVELAKDHAEGKTMTFDDDPVPPVAKPAPGAPPAPPPPPPPLVDAVLERAVQVYHGLSALGALESPAPPAAAPKVPAAKKSD